MKSFRVRKTLGPLATALVIALFSASVTPSATLDSAADSTKLTPAELAAQIDTSLAADWQQHSITPANNASDTEFLRRVSVHLTGRIPSVYLVRTFRDDPSPDKRSAIVEKLLAQGTYASHFANVWREMLLQGTNNQTEARALALPLESWLRLRFIRNAPYDEMVEELLTATSVRSLNRRSFRRLVESGQPTPIAFFQANQRKPELLAANTSRIFLAQPVGCAQCHDHPYAKWKRGDFWSMAAFFTGLDEKGTAEEDYNAPLVDSRDRGGIKIPETEQEVAAKFLDGTLPDWQEGEGKRTTLARWMTARENPYFAKAAVNRLWHHFFGRGFVSPVDDLDPSNSPILPELFSEVTKQFVRHDYDLKYVIRAICLSQAYQRSSASGDNSSEATQRFARAALRRMTADELFDSLAQTTGYQESPTKRSNDPSGGIKNEFLTKFADQSSAAADAETTTLQALAMMNGRLVAEVTSLENSVTLSAIAEYPLLSTPDRIDALFLGSLGRNAAPDERDEMLAYVQRESPARGERAPLADVMWALINCAEFSVQH